MRTDCSFNFPPAAPMFRFATDGRVVDWIVPPEVHACLTGRRIDIVLELGNFPNYYGRLDHRTDGARLALRCPRISAAVPRLWTETGHMAWCQRNRVALTVIYTG